MRTFPLKLLSGYKGFRSAVSHEGAYQHGRLAVEGQKPDTMVVACCDSRVTPELIFSADPGSLFVVRSVANIVPPEMGDGRNLSTAAALEFAVLGLEVKHIVVLGHAQCGGVKAAVDRSHSKPLTDKDHVGGWISWLDNQLINEALTHSHDHDHDPVPAAGHRDDARQRYRAAEEAGIRQSIANLGSFEFVKERVDKGRLTLHGAWFDIEHGQLWVMDNPTGQFHWTDGIDFR
ncbi:MAG: carbonic anhydrase [Pseudomonadota bacterium]